MIEFYGDLAGTERDRLYLAACYIAPAEDWVAADVKWAATLDWANVEQFHATDFFAYPPRGAFEGWKHGSRRHRLAEERFTSILHSEALSGFAWGIETAAFSAMKPRLDNVKAKQRIQSLRLLCVQHCLERVSRFFQINPLHPLDRIVAVWESEKGIGEVKTFFKFAKKRGASWTRKYIDVTDAGKELRPLQIVDLFAYAARMSLEHPKSIRPSLNRVIKSGKVEVAVTTEAHVIASLPAIDEFFAEFPDGLARGPSHRTLQ